MFKVFNHWFRWRQVAEILFDLSFVIIGITVASMWVGSGLPVNYAHVITYAMLLLISGLTIYLALGAYSRVHSRSEPDARIRSILSLYLAVPKIGRAHV